MQSKTKSLLFTDVSDVLIFRKKLLKGSSMISSTLTLIVTFMFSLFECITSSEVTGLY